MSTEAQVAGHYSRDRLADTILAAVVQAGKDPARLTAADLSTLDEFHLGGLRATQDLAAAMDVRAGMRLLDVGCGIGGPARYFATEHACKVAGIDVTEEFVRAAEELTRAVGMDHEAEFRHASAMELPFEAGTFDGAYLIHVGMNIADKAGVFREVRRVVKGGGSFAVFDVMRTADGPLRYPAPWAATEETSFIATPAEYRAALEAAGFRVTGERHRGAFAIEQTERSMERMRNGGAPAGIQVVLGERAPLMVRNILEMLREGVLAPVEMIARAE